MPLVTCPTCGHEQIIPREMDGLEVRCKSCRAEFIADDEYEPPRPSKRQRGRRAEDKERDEPIRTKYCHECGNRIRNRAEICPKCGVRQSERVEDYPYRPSDPRDGIKIRLLISAISNIVVGLIWAATIIGIILTIPMIILCVFEFMLWSKADEMPLRRLNEEVKNLSIFEIVVGVFNTATFVCGIINMANSSKRTRRRYED